MKAVDLIIIMLLASAFPFRLIRTVRSMSMRAVVVDTPGPAENMRIATDVPVPKPGVGQIAVSVAYSGVNRADILQRLGRYPVPPGESDIIGLEVSGVVSALGQNVTNLAVGDRVMSLLSGGGYAEVALAPADHTIRLPPGLSLRQAAAIPEAWLTAYQLLHLVAELRSGERVLVHAAGSGVGTAAVQLVRAAGGIAFGTAGSQQKCQLSQSLGAERCFNYKEEDFCQRLLEATQQAGADVILDCVGSQHLSSNARCLATDARWVLYGLLGGAQLDDKSFLQILLRKRASLRATTLRNRSHQYKSSLIASFSASSLEKFANGELEPIIDSEFPLEEIVAAHKKMEANENLGKILISVNPGIKDEL